MTKTTMLGLLTVVALSTTGCGPILHTEMLGESIRAFTSRAKTTPNEKVWITNPADSACNGACTGCKPEDKGVGGLFSGFSGPKDGSSSYDRLAYEVFSNYLTQRRKVRVVETHRHNYATELNPDTHHKIDVVWDKEKVSTSGCEDLCLLDEAKKRKADKVLAYHIIEMKNDELVIHFRLSDVSTGVVEASQTLKILDLRAVDVSYGGDGGGGGGGRPRPAARSED